MHATHSRTLLKDTSLPYTCAQARGGGVITSLISQVMKLGCKEGQGVGPGSQSKGKSQRVNLEVG